MQLPVGRLLELLARKHSALGKLPASPSDLPAEKNVSGVAHQHDADVSAKSV